VANDVITSAKFLGVLVDPRLTWNDHIDYVAAQLSLVLYLLRRLAVNISAGVLRVVYFAVFHSRLAYGCLTWEHSFGMSRLFKIQRRAIRLMGGYSFRDDCRDGFGRLAILTLPSEYIYQNLVFVREYRDVFSLQGDVHSYGTRQRDNIRGSQKSDIPVKCLIKFPDLTLLNFFIKRLEKKIYSHEIRESVIIVGFGIRGR